MGHTHYVTFWLEKVNSACEAEAGPSAARRRSARCNIIGAVGRGLVGRERGAGWAVAAAGLGFGVHARSAAVMRCRRIAGRGREGCEREVGGV